MSRARNSAAAERLKEYARSTGNSGASAARADESSLPASSTQEHELSQQGDSEPVLTLQRLSDTLLAAIQQSTASLTGKIDEVRIDVNLLRQDMQTLRERVKETEDRISHLEDAAAPIPERLSTLEKAASQWSMRADDLENRLRRNNVRILGLPERAEGADPCAFIESWLKTTLPDAALSSVYAIERAHRVPARPPPPGAPPRPFLARLLSSRDRDAILQAARRKGELRYNNSVIALFPDFSAALQKQRASFLHVKKRLRDMGVQYSMLFPAKLRVVHDERSHFFTSPSDADAWVNAIRRSPKR